MASSSNSSYNIGQILVENLDDLVYILNQDFKCEYINEDIHLEKLGYSCLGKKVTDFIYYSDLKQAIVFLQKILNLGKATEHLRFRHKDKYVYYEVKGKRFTDSFNKSKILLVLYNISNFKELENQWLEREKKLKELAESMPEIRFWKLLQPRSEKAAFHKTREMLDLVIDNIPHFLYWKDKNLVYLGCNQQYANVNSIDDPNMIVGMTDYDLNWPKINLDQIQESEKRVIRTNKRESTVESWTLPDGEKVWFQINRIPLHDYENEVMGILSIYNDISETVIANQKIKESEQKYRSILENIKESYCEVDLEGNFTFFNDSLCDITGYLKHELMGKNYKEMTDKPNGEKVYQLFNNVYNTGIGQPYFQFEFNNKSNAKVTVESSVYLRYDSSGKKIGFFGIVRDITEKYILEEKLKQSEEKYRLISENAYDLISIFNQDLRFEYANERPWLLMLGYSNEEIIGESVLTFVHPDDKKIAIKTMVDGLKNGESVMEVRIRHKDGHWVWIEVKGNAFTDKDDKIKGIVIGRDITERKTAEQKIKESEEKYHSIFSASPDFIYLTDLDGNILDANRALIERTKVSHKDIIDKSFIDFFAGDNLEELMTIFNDLKSGKSIKGLEILAKNLQGEIYECEIDAVPLKEEGKVVKILSFAREITARKQAKRRVIESENKLRALNKELERIVLERTKELRESEEKFRHLYEFSPYGIVLVNLGGIITDINSTVPEIFGFTKEDLIGKNYMNLMGIYPEETRTSLRQISDLLSRGDSIKAIIKPQTIKIFKKDGSLAWIESEISILQLVSEPMIQIIIQDITEKQLAQEKLKESERILREQNIELKELDKLKTDFISIAAHELKTPLISVGGYVDLILMREKDSLSPEIFDDLQHVLNNVHRLEDYINRLMDVMKIDANKMELIQIEEYIYEIIENCLSELEFQIRQKNLNIELSVDKNLKMKVDSFRISQVFSNILSNAVKFTLDDGLVQISAKREGDNYIFSIKDNGQGLTEGEIEQLFAKFVSLGRSTENFSTFEKGSGLGLYIAKGIIEKHGGTIWVESEGKNKGAEFSFLLPIK